MLAKEFSNENKKFREINKNITKLIENSIQVPNIYKVCSRMMKVDKQKFSDMEILQNNIPVLDEINAKLAN